MLVCPEQSKHHSNLVKILYHLVRRKELHLRNQGPPSRLSTNEGISTVGIASFGISPDALPLAANFS